MKFNTSGLKYNFLMKISPLDFCLSPVLFPFGLSRLLAAANSNGRFKVVPYKFDKAYLETLLTKRAQVD